MTSAFPWVGAKQHPGCMQECLLVTCWSAETQGSMVEANDMSVGHSNPLQGLADIHALLDGVQIA